jgi:hypothetical protein
VSTSTPSGSNGLERWVGFGNRRGYLGGKKAAEHENNAKQHETRSYT